MDWKYEYEWQNVSQINREKQHGGVYHHLSVYFDVWLNDNRTRVDCVVLHHSSL